MSLKITDYKKVREVVKKDAIVGLYEKDCKYIIHRYAARGKINNFVANYEFIDSDNNSKILELDEKYGNLILDKFQNNEKYSNIFLFYADNIKVKSLPVKKSLEEHKYTSTGIKFWRHQEQMINYKNNNPNSVVSTHISPEGACNLKCPYCSVTYRDTHPRIPLDTIKNYVLNLKKNWFESCYFNWWRRAHCL